jgi:hypothetical protein
LEGRLRAVKFGGRYLVRTRDLEDFIGGSHTLDGVAAPSPQRS